MTTVELHALVTSIAPVLRDQIDLVVTKATTPLLERLAQIEGRVAATALVAPVHGRDGKDGTSVTRADVEPMIHDLVVKAVSALPTPKDGQDGRNGADGQDGTSITIEDVAPVIADQVAKAVASLPAPKDGLDGAPGRDGTSVTRDDIAPLVVSEVAKAVAAIPVPKDGKDGADGTSLTVADVQPVIAAEVLKAVAQLPQPKDGERGPAGPAGASIDTFEVEMLVRRHVDAAFASVPSPKDGIGVVGALLDRYGHLVLTLSDGQAKDVGLVVGRDGTDVQMDDVARVVESTLATWPKPRDGQDGLGFDAMEGEYDDHGRLFLRFTRGDHVKRYRVPCVIDRGVWRQGETYLTGDGVTWGGSFWVAQCDGTEMPGFVTPSPMWRLAVKHGRDGKQGQKGEKGDTGDRGPKGEDGKVYR